MFIPVAEMVLAELAGGVALALEQLRDGHVAGLKALRGARHADFGVAGAQSALAGDERGAPRCAALLGVIVGEDHAFLGDTINVWRLEAHQSHRVGADIGLPDIVAPDDNDVRFFLLRSYWKRNDRAEHKRELRRICISFSCLVYSFVSCFLLARIS